MVARRQQSDQANNRTHQSEKEKAPSQPVPVDEKEFFRNAYQLEMSKLDQRLKSDSSILKTTTDSRESYQKYDDREQIDYETRSRQCLFDGKIVEMSFREIRDRMLAYLRPEIDRLSCVSSPTRILEVGCGNCINLVKLAEEYGDSIQLTGIDISSQRLKVAKEYFGDRLSAVDMHCQSIIDADQSQTDSFDLVFSMHCLEQIPYRCHDAVVQMQRLAKHRIVMIEPVFELGGPLQKLYLINNDHNRILLKTVKQLGLGIERLESLNIQGNPCNQSSVLVIDSSAAAA